MTETQSAVSTDEQVLSLDIWTDIVCPYCFLGKRRLEAALADYSDPVQLNWHAFQLDRDAPAVSQESVIEHVAAKYGTSVDESEERHQQLVLAGTEVGIDFRFDLAQRGNTFDAHRVIAMASEQGLGSQAVERLMTAYFTEGRAIGDRATLVELAGEIGLDAEAVAAMLEGEKYGNTVRSDEATAHSLGVQGVPFFVFDQRYAVSGAQAPETFTRALTAAQQTLGDPLPAPSGGGCGSGGCGCRAGNNEDVPAESGGCGGGACGTCG